MHEVPLPQWPLLALDDQQSLAREHEEVLAGEAILIIEGDERPLRQWDFVHCPPGTRHAFVGTGTGPCT
ncbi:MAG: cupin domain-containing protein, partial [Actinobacteria bacterium]|nr:cupin domain-containing protein [Actinomycetota bacterium]